MEMVVIPCLNIRLIKIVCFLDDVERKVPTNTIRCMNDIINPNMPDI